MNDIAKLLRPPTTETAPFPPTSRYYGLPIRRAVAADGREVAFVARRFLPPLDSFETSDVHISGGRDRLDLLAARYFGDPEQGWRLVEANGLRDPRMALQEAGTSLRIATPTAVPGRAEE